MVLVFWYYAGLLTVIICRLRRKLESFYCSSLEKVRSLSCAHARHQVGKTDLNTPISPATFVLDQDMNEHGQTIPSITLRMTEKLRHNFMHAWLDFSKVGEVYMFFRSNAEFVAERWTLESWRFRFEELVMLLDARGVLRKSGCNEARDLLHSVP